MWKLYIELTSKSYRLQRRWRWTNLIYCCEEHVDLALDMVVDEHETFPILEKVDVDNLSTSCEFCQNTAIYVVANE
ncbi:CxxH/CxxC protein [Bacillus sp. FJAT-27245]|uniref:CxxH/CxxC protein n=1 Tax=Bacillus sp. FJAT-27245 TaxID=1684144 RepID=UPI003FA4A310